MSIEKAMGLGERLAAAEALVPWWGLRHRLLGELATLDDVSRAARTGTVQDRDEVLRDLARLANKDGGDCEEAAAVLCKLLIPGVVSKLMTPRGFRSIRLEELNREAAFNLWVECRSFPWESDLLVPSHIVWRVRRLTLAAFGVADPRRADRSWANTVTFGDCSERAKPLWSTPDEPESAAEELDRYLAAAQEQGLVSADDVELLCALAVAAGESGTRAAGAQGLMGVQVSDAVGRRLGLAGRTVRRRTARSLAALSDGRTQRRILAS
ncbi:hypothetical protein [Raineyella sp.]|uniref:hypothetical protein n=1 Tax=Raineyella sp. TaxID=1911550 RepID=UPI002B201909|nr:hypothetical protein [Raineyella sp.]MEA5055306.1 hypothetical protein [Propionicimonas sp.]MEA5155651.1 hypothetical protein [Raineyella sp.]